MHRGSFIATLAAFLLAALLLLVVSGCGSAAKPHFPTPALPPVSEVRPIDAQKMLFLYPYRKQLVVFHSQTNQVERTVQLARLAIDYRVAPNGNIYIPMHDNPGDRKSCVAVVDPRTGKVTHIETPAASLGTISITPSGTAFIRTGSINSKEEFLMVLLDTHTDQIKGVVPLPGSPDMSIPYSEREVLVPVTNSSGFGGNLYIVNDQMEVQGPIFPFDLEPFAPQRVIMQPGSQVAYCLYAGFPPEATAVREMRLPHLSDPRLLDTHIDIWDLAEKKLLRRIFLPVTSAQSMVLGPDGRLYVGHQDMTGHSPITEITVISPETGEVQRVQTVPDPGTLMIRGNHLYIGSRKEPVMDVLRLPEMTAVARIPLEHVPWLPPLTLAAE